MNQKRLGEFIKDYRKMRGLTQQKLAQLVSLDKAYIVRLEAGEQLGSPGSLIAVAKSLGLRPGIFLDILAGEESGEEQIKNLRTVEVPQNFSNQDMLEIMWHIELIKEKREKEAEEERLKQLERQLGPKIYFKDKVKIIDGRYIFFPQENKLHPTICHIYIEVDQAGRGSATITNLLENRGLSTTNAFERIATELVQKYELEPELISWYEDYETVDYGEGNRISHGKVKLTWEKDHYVYNPL